MPTKKIAINGFGRIGRLFFRLVHGNPLFDIVAVNDLGTIDNLAYLLSHDSAYGRYGGHVSAAGTNLQVDGKEIAFLNEKDPEKLPWKDLGIDVVLESTGVFETYEKANAHIRAGAKRVVITAPAKDEDGMLGKTILAGVNEASAETVVVTSNASCTTNAVSPVIEILREQPGIEKAILNTVHGYTATQHIVDTPVKGSDWRRGRAAAQNIIPSTTGAAIAVTRAIPELSGKFDGIAMRVPVLTGSIADITFITKRNTTVEEVNDILKKAAASPRWQGVFKVSEEQLVSSDIIGEPYAAIADLNFTKVVGGNLVKVLSWYDNEAGYVKMLARHIERLP